MNDLYEVDIVAWSEQQAELLRRRALPDARRAIDWDHIIEEIECVGKEQLHAVQSLLVQTLIHRLKADLWPSSRDAPSWRGEAERLSADVFDRFTPSMRAKLDLAKIYRRALRALPETIDGMPPASAPPPASPWSLDELLTE
jgi:hypothetical protein